MTPQIIIRLPLIDCTIRWRKRKKENERKKKEKKWMKKKWIVKKNKKIIK